MKLVFKLKFHWSLFLRVQLTMIHHLFRKWLGTCLVPSHYLNQWWPSLLMHTCVTRPQWVNTCILKPGVAYLHQWTTSLHWSTKMEPMLNNWPISTSILNFIDLNLIMWSGMKIFKMPQIITFSDTVTSTFDLTCGGITANVCALFENNPWSVFYPRTPSALTGIVISHCIRTSVCLSIPNDIPALTH